MSNLEQFKVTLCEKQITFYEKNDLIIINHQGYVDLESLTTLPENVKFENQGYVYLENLTTLPENVKFENQGYVDLRNLTTLPENITYRNQKIRIKTIDGYTMVLDNKRNVGENVVYKARYFGGGELADLKKCFLASNGEHWAHGKTSREAVEDLRFKVMSVDFDKEDILSEIKSTQRVRVNDYRLLTGACKEGCREFLRSMDLAEDTESLPLNHVIEIIHGHYGASSALELLKPLLKKGGADE